MALPWIGTIIPWSAALRARPYKSATRPYEGVLKDLPRGTRVMVVAQQGAWLSVKVTLENRTLTGYVSQGLVKFVSVATTDGASAAGSNVRIQVYSRAAPSAPLSRFDQEEILDGLQGVIDIIGFIPCIGEVADLVNAGISAARGNYLDAALSLVSLIPGVGDAIGKGAKYALKFADAGAARKALAALQNVDLAGFFNRLMQYPQLRQYIEPLRRALEVLLERLAHLARVPAPQLAMAGGGRLPSGPPRSNVVRMSGNPANVAKRGDHLFNLGLMKLELEVPRNLLLNSALKEFQAGMKHIEAMGGFKIVANKGAHAEDLNSKLFGERLANLRNAWNQLNTVLDNPANAQHRAAAVLWTTEALEQLRKVCFDEDAMLARLKGVSSSDARKIKEQVDLTARQLDKVFDDLVKEVQRFMPPPGAVGQSMAGLR